MRWINFGEGGALAVDFGVSRIGFDRWVSFQEEHFSVGRSRSALHKDDHGGVVLPDREDTAPIVYVEGGG